MRRVFAADIGGTSARFASFVLDDGKQRAGRGFGADSVPDLELERAAWLPTSELTDTASVLAAFGRALDMSPDALGTAEALVFALAGPVAGGRGSLTNGALRLDLADARQLPPAFLINDFQAQAYACAGRPGKTARPVVTPAEETRGPGGPRAVVGAGTGLGMAVLCGCGDRLLALPSEAGHADFPFAGGEESRFQEFVREHTGLPRVVGDVVLTGRGLALLHRYLTGEILNPREVSRRALRGDTPTLRWYARLYGRFCRNAVLTTLCTGGLWIAGGIAADNPLAVTGESFAEEFFASAGVEPLLRRVPVFLMDDKNSGLWGAAYAGLLQPGGIRNRDASGA
ncbi:MAG: glucokinase [Desulfovibrio sp.]|jgi:glucokinase|nr:glucokinase [Desulfovibrio sp.]